MKTENKRRLSEVMRAGAALRPQGNGNMFSSMLNPVTGEPDKVVSCALGSAYEGAFCRVGFNVAKMSKELKAVFPILARPFYKPTHRGDPAEELGWVIVLLNDLDGWTREEIADFVEKCECEEASKDIATDRFLAHREPEPVLT